MKHKLIIAIAALALTASPAAASTPKQTIAKLRAQVAALTQQRDAARTSLATAQTTIANIAAENAKNSTTLTATYGTLAVANANSASATGFLADCRATLAATTTQLAGARSALSGPVDAQINGMDATGLWAALATVKSRLDAVGGVGYGSALQPSPGALTYTFNRFGG